MIPQETVVRELVGELRDVLEEARNRVWGMGYHYFIVGFISIAVVNIVTSSID